MKTTKLRRVLPLADRYNDARATIVVNGRRMFTPILVVMIAIGTTDLIFALDSIPAIFGLTQEPYLVFTANVFALMGLRQLYFLLGGLVTKLVYLSYGLAVILGFIGAKLFLHALYEYHVVPDWLEINNWVSLGVIVAVLAITSLASLAKTKRTESLRAEDPATVGRAGR